MKKITPQTVKQGGDTGTGPVGRQNAGSDAVRSSSDGHQGHAKSSEKVTSHHRGAK